MKPQASFDPRNDEDLAWDGKGETDDQGRRTGRWDFPFTDGAKAFLTYVDGRREGQYGCWHADGVVEDGQYLDGHKSGRTSFSRDNRVIRVEEWMAGKLQGILRIINPARNEIRFYCFDQNELHGEAKTTVHGKLVLRRRFDRGKLAGLYEAWWEDGETPRVTGQYDDGRKHGEWRMFDENGQLASTQVWDHGALVCEINESG